MSYLNGSFTQRTSVVDNLDPVSQAAATVNMAAVDMLYFARVMYVLNVGAVGAAGTVDFKLQLSVNGTSGWTDATGKGITQITAASKIAKVGIIAEDLSNQGAAPLTYRYVRGVLVVGTNAVLICVTAYGTDGRFKPENKFKEVAAVTQTIADTN